MYNPTGQFLGDVPFVARTTTPPNRSTPGTPQPTGTKFLAEGEGYTAKSWNRALTALSAGLDKVMTMALTYDASEDDGDGTFLVGYENFSVAFGVTLDELQIDDWVVVGSTTNDHAGLPQNLATVLYEDRQVFVEDTRVAPYDWLDSLGASVADGVIRAATTALSISNATRYSVDCGDWTSDPEYFPGSLLLVESSTANAHDGVWAITETVTNTHKLSTPNYLHTLRITGVTLATNWVPGALVKGATSGVEAEIVYAGPSGTPPLAGQPDVSGNGWIQVEIADDDYHMLSDFLADTQIEVDLSAGSPFVADETANIVSYEMPGDSANFDSTAFGSATGTLYGPPGIVYGPTADFDDGGQGEDVPGPNAAGTNDYVLLYTRPSFVGALSGASNKMELSLGANTLSQVVWGDPYGHLKLAVKVQTGEAIGSPQISVLDSSGTAVFTADETGKITISNAIGTSTAILAHDLLEILDASYIVSIASDQVEVSDIAGNVVATLNPGKLEVTDSTDTATVESNKFEVTTPTGTATVESDKFVVTDSTDTATLEPDELKFGDTAGTLSVKQETENSLPALNFYTDDTGAGLTTDTEQRISLQEVIPSGVIRNYLVALYGAAAAAGTGLAASEHVTLQLGGHLDWQVDSHFTGGNRILEIGPPASSPVLQIKPNGYHVANPNAPLLVEERLSLAPAYALAGQTFLGNAIGGVSFADASSGWSLEIPETFQYNSDVQVRELAYVRLFLSSLGADTDFLLYLQQYTPPAGGVTNLDNTHNAVGAGSAVNVPTAGAWVDLDVTVEGVYTPTRAKRVIVSAQTVAGGAVTSGLLSSAVAVYRVNSIVN